MYTTDVIGEIGANYASYQIIIINNVINDNYFLINASNLKKSSVTLFDTKLNSSTSFKTLASQGFCFLTQQECRTLTNITYGHLLNTQE